MVPRIPNLRRVMLAMALLTMRLLKLLLKLSTMLKMRLMTSQHLLSLPRLAVLKSVLC